MQLFLLVLLAVVAVVLGDVTLLSFDGTPSTTSKTWSLTNDPVMGGLSYSNYTVNGVDQKMEWTGSVEIVPSLEAPGFCNLMSELKQWPSASKQTHLMFKARSTVPYKGFKVSFAADTLSPQFKCFKSDFEMSSTGEWEEIAIPFNQFSNNWSSYTGEPIVTCAEDASVCPTDKNLADIKQIGFWMEGGEGKFNFEFANVRAGVL